MRDVSLKYVSLSKVCGNVWPYVRPLLRVLRARVASSVVYWSSLACGSGGMVGVDELDVVLEDIEKLVEVDATLSLLLLRKDMVAFWAKLFCVGASMALGCDLWAEKYATVMVLGRGCVQNSYVVVCVVCGMWTVSCVEGEIVFAPQCVGGCAGEI